MLSNSRAGRDRASRKADVSGRLEIHRRPRARPSADLPTRADVGVDVLEVARALEIVADLLGLEQREIEMRADGVAQERLSREVLLLQKRAEFRLQRLDHPRRSDDV